MAQRINIPRIFLSLATIAVMVLASGSLALGSENPVPTEDSASQVTGNETPSGCGCCSRGARVEAKGGSRPGLDARPGGRSMRHRQGQGQGQGMEPGQRQGMRAGGCRMGQGGGNGMGMGMGPGMGRGGMEAIHALVHDYRQDIVREVEDIENGVATTTRSPDNPEAVVMLQRHVGEMKSLLGDGGRIRAWDPLFSELFDHSHAIEMVVETLPDGVRVIETSSDPEVVKLIRAHARKVSEFVERGPAAVHETTPLPVDYQSNK